MTGSEAATIRFEELRDETKEIRNEIKKKTVYILKRTNRTWR